MPQLLLFIFVLFLQCCNCTIPVDAPFRLDLGDGGIFYILKPQIFLEMSLVYAHRHGHVSIAI